MTCRLESQLGMQVERRMKRTLYPEFLLEAYSSGYFPMPDPITQEILWYRPDPRAVIPLENFHCSKSLVKVQKRFQVTFNKAFSDVMKGCADRAETWINEEILTVYQELHARGNALSVEVWDGIQLAGGLYGVKIAHAFFAESKFHKKPNASKIALWALVEHLKANEFQLLEVQFLTPHLKSLGAVEVSDEEYQSRLERALRARL